jgi:hypothetical protein
MLEYKICGPIFDEGIPLHVAINALSNFHSVVDKTYLVAIGSKRLTSRDREIFQLKASSISRGSLLTKFEIIIATYQFTLPFMGTLGPDNIWEFTKNTFDFLKAVCGAVQRDEKPTYDFDNNGDVNVHIGDTHNHYHAQVIQIGELSLPSFQELAHLIEPNKIKRISAGKCGQENPDIHIGQDDKKIFDLPTRIEQETILLKCEIFDFNKYRNIGKLSVSNDYQQIPIGEYNFTIFGSQDNVNYIQSMLKKEVELYCLVEMESNPFGNDKVYKLHITGVK